MCCFLQAPPSLFDSFKILHLCLQFFLNGSKKTSAQNGSSTGDSFPIVSKDLGAAVDAKAAIAQDIWILVHRKKTLRLGVCIHFARCHPWLIHSPGFWNLCCIFLLYSWKNHRKSQVVRTQSPWSNVPNPQSIQFPILKDQIPSIQQMINSQLVWQTNHQFIIYVSKSF